jgi:hypothetical protein
MKNFMINFVSGIFNMIAGLVVALFLVKIVSG